MSASGSPRRSPYRIAFIEVDTERALEQDVFRFDGAWSGSRASRLVVHELHCALGASGAKFRDLVDQLAFAKPAPLSLLCCLSHALFDPEFSDGSGGGGRAKGKEKGRVEAGRQEKASKRAYCLIKSMCFIFP